MHTQVHQVKTAFAKELQRRCADKYNKFPSNEKLARDLCLTSKYQMKVSRETVRKWLKGDTFPDLDCLLHLIEWLQLDVNNIFLIKTNNQNILENPQSGFNFSDSDYVSLKLDAEQVTVIIKVLKVHTSTEIAEKIK